MKKRFLVAKEEVIQSFEKKVRLKRVEETPKGSQVSGASKTDRLHIHRKKGECYICGKLGHYTKEYCYKKKTIESNAVTSQGESISEEECDTEECCAATDLNHLESTSNVIENEVLALHAEDKSYENDWIIDSGCYNHMTRHKKKLQNII
ncbi:Integrase, catalytic core [Cucumis melo var. makuwa]|uniref:Integrase, catalytic core n=1 Tax=Cucumis melo var. makuwa TaxID=1194695 RepID=A0A5D3DDS2_CUCMM|nr:Integrase, catalytic core [Cucumis melo var. makuwa]TYK21857.1 Integrase, catalytic core [Cucumis melo var. makuwa]